MIVVDSSVWIGLFRDHAGPQVAWLEANIDTDLATTDLSLCEVLQGARRTQELYRFRKLMTEFPVLQAGGVEVAIDAAERYAWLRSKGITVGATIDCLIATFCIREGHVLLHNDRDFDPFERYFDLKVVRP